MSNINDNNTHEIIDMELEAIKAIYLDDINIKLINNCDKYMANILMNILPKTGDQTSDQLVRLSLAINLPKMYPNELPVFEFHNTRGLNDEKIDTIKLNIEMVSKERLGETMLYDVIEKCRDLLTSFNFPIGNRCALCLYEFTIKDQIMKNECFHHLHSRCFADYVIYMKKSQTFQEIQTNNSNKSLTINNEIKVECPVCRSDLDITQFNSNIDPNEYALPYLSIDPLKDEIILIEEAKQSVNKFNHIYQKQLKNGGIIDEETERNKFFIRISEDNNESTTS